MRTHARFALLVLAASFAAIYNADGSVRPDKGVATTPCYGLSEIRQIPPKAGVEVDDVHYNEIRKMGAAAVSCLIDNIANTKYMVDPRSEPSKVTNFVVGDLAFFVLTDLGHVRYAEALPKDVLLKQKEIGVYAYFEWVAKPGSREWLQKRCRELAKSGL